MVRGGFSYQPLFTYHYSLGKERADPLISTYRKRKYAFKASFCFGSFVSSVDWDRGQRPRPQRNRKVKDQAEHVTMLTPGAYQRGGLPRPFREISSWDRLGA